jgi:carbonic anhydrase/acetyltransferase-like protein (isoleucine patch superfamily)
MLLSYFDQFPRVEESVFCAGSADIIGDVEIAAQSSVWFGVVIRGDVNRIRIGSRTSVQDGSVIHVTKGTHPTLIGDDVTIGHNVTLHGCTIGNRCLIGMGAIILDGAVIKDDAKVAAGALVTPGTVVESGTLYVGSPARYKRDLTADEIADLVTAAQNYVIYAESYRGIK